MEVGKKDGDVSCMKDVVSLPTKGVAWEEVGEPLWPYTSSVGINDPIGTAQQTPSWSHAFL